jgi:hypothetical protein
MQLRLEHKTSEIRTKIVKTGTCSTWPLTLYTDSLQGLVAHAHWEVITAGHTRPVEQFHS